MGWFDRDAGKVEAVVATIRPYDNSQRVDDIPSRTGGEAWQSTAWQLWRRLGELHYPTTQIARLVSRVTWVPEPVFDLEAVTGPDSVAETARLLALNLQVAGEVWYIHTEKNDEGRQLDEPRWEVVSTAAPKWEARVKQADVKLRVWVADPVFNTQPDSPVQSVIGPARELLTLEAQSRSQSRSRLSQGILLRPKAEDAFSDDFRTGMMTPVRDEDSVAAVVPMDIETSDVEAWKFLTLERPYDERIPDKMERAIRRIALGLDIHPELLLGIADVNHWTGWLVQEDTWTSHTAPVAQLVADTFAAAAVEFLSLEAAEVTPDPSEILARRSTVRDALDVSKIGGVGLSFVRDAIGATDEDAPTDEDIEIIAQLTGRGDRAGLVEENPGPPEAIAAAAAPPEDSTSLYLARVDDVLAGRLAGLLDAETAHIRGRVGAKVRSSLNGRRDLLGRVDAVPNSDVVATLGLATVEETADVAEIIANSVDDTVAMWTTVLDRTVADVGKRLDVDLDTPARRDAIEASAEHLRAEFATWLATTLERTTADMPEPPDGRETIRIAGYGV